MHADARKPEEPDGHEQRPDGHRRTRADPPDEARGDAGANDDAERGRKKREAGLQRREAKYVLEE